MREWEESAEYQAVRKRPAERLRDILLNKQGYLYEMGTGKNIRIFGGGYEL